MTAGSWYLEANIAYCTQESPSELTLYYTVNMATIVYQFQEKLKTDTEEPNLIMEEDPKGLEDTSPTELQRSHTRLNLDNLSKTRLNYVNV